MVILRKERTVTSLQYLKIIMSLSSFVTLHESISPSQTRDLENDVKCCTFSFFFSLFCHFEFISKTSPFSFFPFLFSLNIKILTLSLTPSVTTTRILNTATATIAISKRASEQANSLSLSHFSNSQNKSNSFSISHS